MYSKIAKKILHLDYVLSLLFCIIIGGFFFLPTSPHRIVLYCIFITGFLYIIRENDWHYIFDRPNKIFLYALGFLFYALISNFWSEIADFERLLQQVKPAIFIPAFMIICVSFFKKRMQFLSLLTEIYVLCSLVTAVIIILLNLGDIYDSYIVESAVWRIEGFGRAENSNQAGLFYGIALLNLCFLRPTYINILQNKYFRTLCALCIFAVFCLTLSRGAFLAFCGTSVFLVLVKGYLSGVNLKLLSLPILAILSLSIITAFVFPHLLIYMIERGTTGRFELWQIAMGQYLDAPIFGRGAGTKFYYELILPNHVFIAGHVHNLYLSILVHFGLVGFLIFASLTVHVLLGLLQYVKRTGDYSWLIFFVYGLLFGLVDLGGHYNSLSSSWMIFWIPASILIAHQKCTSTNNADAKPKNH